MTWASVLVNQEVKCSERGKLSSSKYLNLTIIRFKALWRAHLELFQFKIRGIRGIFQCHTKALCMPLSPEIQGLVTKNSADMISIEDLQQLKQSNS